MIESVIQDAGFCALLVRKANTAGGTEMYVLRNNGDIAEAQKHFRPSDIVHVFTRAVFPSKGRACSDNQSEAMTCFEELMQDGDVEYVDALCLGSATVRLDETEYSGLCNTHDVTTWLEEKEGRLVALGYMGIYYEDDFEALNTPVFRIAYFYVPWPDGTIRSGSY